ncbi:MAG: restriction endonuclease subunit S [Treponema sp.]|nr:restriction endonuclease subunit S [Treponema sp.]
MEDAHVPYSLPKGWIWCKLHDIADLYNGDRGENYPSKKDYVETGIPFINAGCLDNGFIDYSVANYITEQKFNSLRAGKIKKDDILYCLRGSLGKTGIVRNENKGAISSSLCIFRLTTAIIPEYFLSVLNSSIIKKQQNLVDNGTAQPNLSAKDVSNYLIPVPSLNEQKRITAKINVLYDLLDEIVLNLV